MHTHESSEEMRTLRKLQDELAEIRDRMVTREDLLSLSHEIHCEIRELTIDQERIHLDTQRVQRELVSLVHRTGLLKNEACSTRERFTTIELKIESFCRERTKAGDTF